MGGLRKVSNFTFFTGCLLFDRLAVEGAGVGCGGVRPGVCVNMINIHGCNRGKLSVLHDPGYNVMPCMQEISNTQQCTDNTSLSN